MQKIVSQQGTGPRATSCRNTGRHHLGMPGRLRRNPHATAGDPIGAGIVASLARPGGNITGLSSQTPDAAGKKLELFRQVVPNLHRLATLADVDNPYAALDLRQINESARTLGIEVATFAIQRSEELESVFDVLKRRVDGLYVLPVPLLFANRKRISALALSFRRCMGCKSMSKRAVSCPMGRTGHTCGGALRTLSIKYYAEPSPATFQSSSRLSSIWSLT
jgi:ABC transporter substrate binding protein